MKRTPLKRKKPLRRKKPIDRRRRQVEYFERKGLKRPIGKASPNQYRGGSRSANPDVFGPQSIQCRKAPCCACRGRRNLVQRYKSEAHHDPSRAPKGRGRDEDTLPLCKYHHTDLSYGVHGMGRETFQQYFMVDFEREKDVMRMHVLIHVMGYDAEIARTLVEKTLPSLEEPERRRFWDNVRKDHRERSRS